MSIPITVIILSEMENTIALRFFLRAIVFLIHVSVRDILKRILVYEGQD
jgi:hypothetical protein